jgi:phage terminase large subunit-like protein
MQIKRAVIKSVRRVDEPVAPTYNISVAQNHNYFANGILCHNCDDGNNPKDQSDIMLENALHFWQRVLPSRLNDPKTGRKINVQQRVHEKDISGFILENMADDWVKLILPAEFEPDRRCVTVPLPSTKGKPWRDPRTVENELLHPARVGRKELDRLKRELASEYAVAGQLQQRPAPTEGGILKRKWFRLWAQKEPPKLEFSLLSFDTALSEAKSAAYSAATTWGVFRDEHGIPNIILLSVWRERCEYPELRERVKRMAVDYLDDAKEPRKSQYPKRPDMVLIEKKSSGHALVQDLLRADVVTVPFDPTRLGDKTQRVRLITPILESGRVWVPARGPDFTQPRDFAEILVSQAGLFPKGTSRDLVDTMTQALWKIQSGGWVWNPNDRAPAPETKVEREAFY